MTTPAATARERALSELRAHAEELFAADPELRSLLFAVAQYWNDQADDEVHAFVVASARTVPVWPHVCRYLLDLPHALPGEACSNCGEAIDPPWLGVPEWEPYCHEHGSQDLDYADSYLPYAIVRLADSGAEVEVIGRLQRPAAELSTMPPYGDEWTDPQARRLFDQICAHPDDDGPRAVLSDYLLETGSSPRGELIALSLARSLAPEARARRDRLLAHHARRWIGPLGAVLPEGCARFERGFLARADVYAADTVALAHVRGAAAWGTVHTLRYLADSLPVLDEAMVALRDIGPLGPADIGTLVRASRPWSIETLLLAALDDTAITALARTPLLPRLRRLVLPDASRRALDAWAAAPWWPQLDRVTVLVDLDDSEDGIGPAIAPWRTRLRDVRAPWLAIAARLDELPGPTGWEIAFGPAGAVEITMRDWHPRAELPQLARIVRELPGDARIELVPSPRRVFNDDDLHYLREHAGREVAIAPR